MAALDSPVKKKSLCFGKPGWSSLTSYFSFYSTLTLIDLDNFENSWDISPIFVPLMMIIKILMIGFIKMMFWRNFGQSATLCSLALPSFLPTCTLGNSAICSAPCYCYCCQYSYLYLPYYSACISTSCIRVKNQINKSIIIGASSLSTSKIYLTPKKTKWAKIFSQVMTEQLLRNIKKISCSKK